MRLQPTSPIVVDEHGDISAYPSVIAACSEMEPIDVAAGEYEAFDSRAHRLTIGVASGVVWMDLEDGVHPETEELTRRLRRFIREVGPERVGLAGYESESLAALLSVLGEFLNTGHYGRGEK